MKETVHYALIQGTSPLRQPAINNYSTHTNGQCALITQLELKFEYSRRTSLEKLKRLCVDLKEGRKVFNEALPIPGHVIRFNN